MYKPTFPERVEDQKADNYQPVPREPDVVGVATPRDTELPHTEEKDRRGNHHARLGVNDVFAKLWLWEIVACLFSLVCLAAIIIVLKYEDGKQLDQWSLVISPTAVISFLATISKSSFMLAITEVLGQLKWLHFNGQPRRLADLSLFDRASRGPYGGFVLILRRHRHSLLACFAALITIAGLLMDPFVQLVFSFPSRLVVDSELVSSFSASRNYTPSNYRAVSSFALLGNIDPAMTAAIMQDFVAFLETEGPTVSQCQFKTPNNQTLQTVFATMRYEQGIFGTQWNASALFGGSEATDAPATLVSFEAVQPLAMPASISLDDVRDLPVAGWSCSLSLCAKTYPFINVTNGVINVTAPEEDPLLFGSTAPFYDTLYSNTSSAISNYSFQAIDYENLNSYLSVLFSTGFFSEGINTMSSNALVYLDNAPEAPPVGSRLGVEVDIDAAMNRLASSMTEPIRASLNGTAHAGQTLVEKTFIHVSWRWLALPVALAVLSFVLVIAAIVVTRRSGVEVWKTEVLPLLFAQLRGFEAEEVDISGAGGRRSLEERGLRLRANLSRPDELAFIKGD
ncbi:uncharacterized protein Triagg1_9705 [Trichoderma aggressivum f. europaeum]|uniref:Uncharacterized protein n=1 Tax=Trichoderma aggressivum f. europaeum TaxID=173218 RepID=A0AAE1I861_9HYPO|nr:hypothetical protein Triagg1_9705 [Trichoderma aggressivum f. europaeum]